MGLDRIGRPPGRVVRAAVTGRWRRRPAGPCCRAARRRSSSRWRAISCSRYGCIDVGPPHLVINGVSSARRLGGPGNMIAGLFFRRRDHRHGRAPWPGPHRGPAGRAAGPHARGARAGPSAGGYGSAALALTSSAGHPSRGGRWRAARPCWPGSSGNGTNHGRRGASPKSACRVECRRGAIPHPKVLHHRVVGDALV